MYDQRRFFCHPREMRTSNVAPDYSSSFSMADMYEAAPSSVTGGAPVSEEMSVSPFLDQFLHHSLSSTSKTKYGHLHHLPQLPQPPGGFFSGENCRGFIQLAKRYESESESRVRDRNSGAAVESSYGVNVSDPGGHFTADAKESDEKTFSSAGVVDSNAKERRVSFENYLGELSCDSEVAGGSEVNAKPVPLRSSSKRSRVAEVHNLSEKMLSMRNRLSLHPMCLPGVQQPAQLPRTGMSSFGGGNGYLNSSSGMGTFPGNEESSRQSVYNLGNQCTLPSQPYVISSGTNATILETSFRFEESSQARCEPLNLSYSKEIDDDGKLQLESDTSEIEKISASNMS
ncbi:hypothetical protein I3842_15G053100 [Carya illinoinensis]|uniref:Uncharacterized protein n=1 Tax=Carya illinoinensis TaxID=32201 RepID=A0A922DAI2_CARIL|nr:hypothetical protein I3842_15G053100 [Carya illinoinensis]